MGQPCHRVLLFFFFSDFLGFVNQQVSIRLGRVQPNNQNSPTEPDRSRYEEVVTPRRCLDLVTPSASCLCSSQLAVGFSSRAFIY